MKWVIQENLYKEVAFTDLIQALESMKCDYEVVKVVPFSHDLIPEPEVNGRAIVMGATTMIGIAKERGWSPGAFFNENFDHRVWVEQYGAYLLNHEALVGKFSEIDPQFDPFFIRPAEDRKVFAGEVMGKANFDLWRKKSLEYAATGYVTLKPDTLVVVAPLKVIHSEFRFFVVEGEVVTGSLYKRGGRVIHLPALPGEPAEVFAREMVKLWQPADAFVIDVAETDEGFKVIEFNCLSSAGFYKANVGKIVGALERYESNQAGRMAQASGV